MVARRSTDPQAYRTISEISEALDVPQHVLRFWESKFPQLEPLKRNGRRRYYRPEDKALLIGIRDLLYVEGYTIRGVQKLLEQGITSPEALKSRLTGMDHDTGLTATSNEAEAMPRLDLPEPDSSLSASKAAQFRLKTARAALQHLIKELAPL